LPLCNKNKKKLVKKNARELTFYFAFVQICA